MKIILFFYTNMKFRILSEDLIRYYKDRGFKEVRHYKSEEVKVGDFYEKNKEILDSEIGDGFWLWKPKIIKDIFDEISEGDAIVYTDAGDLVDIDNNALFDFLKTNDYYFTNWGGNRWSQKICTKRDCFILMNCEDEKYYNTPQMEAGFLVIKKTKETINLVNDFLYYCKIKEAIDNSPNKIGENFENWKFHRNDQSILTNLIVKYNLSFNNYFDSKIKYNLFIP